MKRRMTGRAGRRAWLLGLVTLLTLGTATAITTMTTAAAVDAHIPFGRLDLLAQSPGGIIVRGWAIDPDTKSSIHTDVYADGRALARLTANTYRPDVGTRYGYGNYHGFNTRLPLAAGQHNVCVYAINVGAGTGNPALACRDITLNFSPSGRITSVQQKPGGMIISGWTFDPDSPRTSLSVTFNVDGKLTAGLANLNRPDVATAYPYAGAAHGFSLTTSATQGKHTICVVAKNVSFGRDAQLPCVTPTLNFNPAATITALTQTMTGAQVTGWAQDPDTGKPVNVVISADGKPGTTVLADDAGTTHTGHNFTLGIALTAGTHTICVVAQNLLYGTGPSPQTCKSITLNFNPFGKFDTLTRATGSTSLVVTGWAIDPNTASPIRVTVSVDGVAAVTVSAARARSDIGRAFPLYGSLHGYLATIPANDKEHQVCVTALNYGMGTNRLLACAIINAVHPVPPTAPRSVTAVGGFGGATVSWQPPLSDGGAPWSGYVITTYPSGIVTRVNARTTSTVVMGLRASTRYSFDIVAVNVAGNSAIGHSAIITTQAAPPPQTTPAPVSTSRYIRNVRAATSTDLATMRAEGYADARANPSGHGYIILLDIGGQTASPGGVVLSATTHWVSYANLVADLNAYVDGYHAGQRPSAPVIIAIGTNNDMDVSYGTGVAWGRYVVNPVVSHAAKYIGMRVAGANDIEPGFRANYTATRAWLSGYLYGTRAPFVFNGSADGCAWYATARGCNNGWTMSGLYQLAAGMAPTRIINLPQIYNNTMAAQWKYISLTGVGYNKPRINFGGALTEWTACYQARSCGSLTGHEAWTQMWNQLQSSTHLRVGSLPYSTDLRIDQ